MYYNRLHQTTGGADGRQWLGRAGRRRWCGRFTWRGRGWRADRSDWRLAGAGVPFRRRPRPSQPSAASLRRRVIAVNRDFWREFMLICTVRPELRQLAAQLTLAAVSRSTDGTVPQRFVNTACSSRAITVLQGAGLAAVATRETDIRMPICRIAGPCCRGGTTAGSFSAPQAEFVAELGTYSGI